MQSAFLSPLAACTQMIDVPGMKEFAITSDEALDLKTLPETVVIYGSGYIALEFAGIFNGFGAETHLVYRGELPRHLVKMCVPI